MAQLRQRGVRQSCLARKFFSHPAGWDLPPSAESRESLQDAGTLHGSKEEGNLDVAAVRRA